MDVMKIVYQNIDGATNKNENLKVFVSLFKKKSYVLG